MDKPPTNKDLAFVTVPFSCSEAVKDIKYQEKRQVNVRLQGISHINKNTPVDL